MIASVNGDTVGGVVAVPLRPSALPQAPATWLGAYFVPVRPRRVCAAAWWCWPAVPAGVPARLRSAGSAAAVPFVPSIVVRPCRYGNPTTIFAAEQERRRESAVEAIASRASAGLTVSPWQLENVAAYIDGTLNMDELITRGLAPYQAGRRPQV